METHRKIELQEPEDLVYLLDNVRAAATVQLNEAFPPVEGHDGQEDELRLRIEREVHEYINRTFHLALPNLTINGLDVPANQFLPPLRTSQSSSDAADDPSARLPGSSHASKQSRNPLAPTDNLNDHEPIVVFEPFDDSKRARVEDLCREEEDLLREIAALKRKVPAAAASRFQASASERLKLDDDAFSAYVSSILQHVAASDHSIPVSLDGSGNGGATAAAAAAGGARSTIDVKPLPRQGDTERTFGDAIDGLGRLAKDMPATVAKMDRARLAGEYVVSRR